MQDRSQTPLPALPERADDSHKGDFGRVLVIGGARGMAGAPSMTGLAALRSGAGLVTVAVPASVQPTVAAFSPCYMTVPVGEDKQGYISVDSIHALSAIASESDVVAIGPGMGRGDEVKFLVGALYRDFPMPVVVDADALNALAHDQVNSKVLDAPAGPRILTPHPGEFSRLTGAQAGPDQVDRIEKAGELARRDSSGQTIVVLKGHRTVVSDGTRYAVNDTGNPGMATGGTGDCLTGIIAAFLAQDMEPWDAARLGVHLHGVAGDAAAAKVGETSLIATDLIDALPEAMGRGEVRGER